MKEIDAARARETAHNADRLFMAAVGHIPMKAREAQTIKNNLRAFIDAAEAEINRLRLYLYGRTYSCDTCEVMRKEMDDLRAENARLHSMLEGRTMSCEACEAMGRDLDRWKAHYEDMSSEALARRAENADLCAEILHLREFESDQLKNARDVMRVWAKRAQAAEAEIARLREGLEEVRDIKHDQDWADCVSIATRYLDGGTDDE